jgi:O-antigen/teichoic acid export membrane protein
MVETTTRAFLPLLIKMKGSFIRNLKANSLQLLLNQGFGIAAFYLLATQLPKKDFGELNWALAILLTGFGVLTLGLDQVVLKKIASGEHPDRIVSLYLSHTLFAGILFYTALLAACYLLPELVPQTTLLLLGAGKLFYFLSSPFKQLAAGLEQFRRLLYMSVTSNILKVFLVFPVAFSPGITLVTAAWIYLISDFAELLASAYFARKQFRFDRVFMKSFKHYRELIKEAWPQVGNVVFSAAMARADWILIGIMLSAVKLAEYSFAYKVFEMALTPLLIIGPLLLPYFSRKMKAGVEIENKQTVLLKMEIILSTFIAVIFCIGWAPVVDSITNGKYGSVNTPAILILSATMPLLYVNNFYWSVLFSQNRLKLILGIITITMLVNIIADCWLIPGFQNAGAASGFLIATALQTFLFCTYCFQSAQKIIATLLIVPVSGGCILLAAFVFPFPVWMTAAISVIVFILFVVFTRQVKPNDWKLVKSTIRTT